MEKVNKDKCRIITPMFRVMFPRVFKAEPVMGKGDPKFSMTMSFEKDVDISVVLNSIKMAKLKQWPNPKDWPKNLESPVINGDLPKYEGKEGYKGCWVIKATSSEISKPGVVDYPGGNPILDQAEFYPGCYARAQIFARVWEYMGKTGVHFILDHVQKLKDGKPFGGKGSAKDAFGATAIDLDDETEETQEEVEESIDQDSFM